MNKGLDLSSIPGGQNPASLKTAKNIIYRNRGAVRKAPGVRRIDYAGPTENIQAATQFYGTSGSGQINDIIQVREGKVEKINSGEVTDLGLEVNETDTVVFEKFNNKLILMFENTRPKTYTPGGTTLANLGVLSTHTDPPPTMCVKHHESLWYAGRGDFPHRVTKSAINNIENYELTNGGNQFAIDEGDGDPIGVTGLSKTFRGDLYVFKWNSIHRMTLGSFGYARQQHSDGIGCVHHNTIVTLKNDIIFVSSSGIHSLVATEKYGATEEATLSYPIYEWFQDSVNWAAANKMKAAYDQRNNLYLLSYPSGGSPVNDKILGFNLLTKEFFIWEGCEYPVVTEYFELGRKTVMIGCNTQGLGVLDAEEEQRYDQPFDVEIKTGVIYPVDEKHSEINFTRCFLYAKPTPETYEITFRWYVDSELAGTKTLDLSGGGSGAKINETRIVAANGATSTTPTIQGSKKNIIPLLIDLNSEGSAIEFEIVASPDSENFTELEIYGIIFEYEYNEDSDEPTAT